MDRFRTNKKMSILDEKENESAFDSRRKVKFTSFISLHLYLLLLHDIRDVRSARAPLIFEESAFKWNIQQSM